MVQRRAQAELGQATAASRLMSNVMEEISTKAFEDPRQLPHALPSSFGLRDDAEEITVNRSTWDDIDDYQGLELGASGATLSVSVHYVPNATSLIARDLTPIDTPTDFKLISINVHQANGATARLMKVFANFYNP